MLFRTAWHLLMITLAETCSRQASFGKQQDASIAGSNNVIVGSECSIL